MCVDGVGPWGGVCMRARARVHACVWKCAQRPRQLACNDVILSRAHGDDLEWSVTPGYAAPKGKSHVDALWSRRASMDS